MQLKEGTEKASAGFKEEFGKEPECIAYSPGRINLIGDHTDYNGGLAMPAAINRWVYVAIGKQGPSANVNTREEESGNSHNHSPQLTAYSEAHQEHFSWSLKDALPEETWKKFVAGAYSLWSKEANKNDRVQLYIRGDIPQGAGLSSSAAVGTALLNALSGQSLDPMRLCQLAQQIEHQFLGVETGLLDQMAVVFGRAQELLRIDFQTNDIAYQLIPNDLDIQWVIVDSGAQRSLAHSGYQQRVAETRQGLAEIKAQYPEVSHFRDIKFEHLKPNPKENDQEGLSSIQAKRLHHYLTENQRVKDFAACLAQGKTHQAGKLITQSHHSLRDNYQSSHPQVDLLIETALNLEPAPLGGRIMGGGFGGCAIFMVKASEANTFLKTILEKFPALPHTKARGFIFEGVDGAGVIPIPKEQ